MTTRWQRGQTVMAATVVTVTVVFSLYWAQEVFIPIALAIFLSFLLSPLVSFLQRKGFGRFPSVILAVGLATLVIAALSVVITQQFTALGKRLPEYTPNIKA